MEMQKLNDWINNPELLGNETLDELRSIILRYPYFQTAWLLLLKNLYLLDSPSFKDELRRGALYVADLSILFYFIEGSKFSAPKHEFDGSEKHVVHDRTLDLIDRFLSEIPNDKGLSSELSLPADTVMDYSSLLLLKSNDGYKDETVSETLSLKGQSLIDDFIEKSETGMLSSYNRKSENTEDVDEFCDEGLEATEDDYMDVTTEATYEADVKTVEDSGDDKYLTETLAKIYVKQQRYGKALEIIKKLNLKYPKKNAYFADQIRFLERLIINAKSK